jgi:hypothetical protein
MKRPYPHGVSQPVLRFRAVVDVRPCAPANLEGTSFDAHHRSELQRTIPGAGAIVAQAVGRLTGAFRTRELPNKCRAMARRDAASETI